MVAEVLAVFAYYPETRVHNEVCQSASFDLPDINVPCKAAQGGTVCDV